MKIITLFAATLITTAAFAETPNIQPGLWVHNTTTVIDSPLNFPPQTQKHEECLTAENISKGIEVIDIPEGCTVSQYDAKKDTLDYAMTCQIEGMTTNFSGKAQFFGSRMSGEMRGDLSTPMGPMTIQTKYTAERSGDC